MDTVLTPPQSSNGHKRSPQTADSQATRRDILEELFAEPVSVQESAMIPTNLIDGWASYYLQLSLPALDVKSVSIQSVARRVLVRGRYTVPVVEDGSYTRQGIPAGTVCETFELPGEVDGDKATARYDRGILTIEMPRVDYLKPATVPVEVVG